MCFNVFNIQDYISYIYPFFFENVALNIAYMKTLFLSVKLRNEMEQWIQ
jgi:hypothetical protein